jgi:Mrp family chromosome partitioning ATPase
MRVAVLRTDDDIDFREVGSTKASFVPIVESLKDPSSVAGEELRVFRVRLERLSSSRGLRCIGVVSALPGDGKSTVSLGLTAALARERSRRILLVDADVRRSSVSPALGLSGDPGLSDWLGHEIDHVPVHFVESGGFFVLAAGGSGRAQPEALGSPRMEALLQAARKKFDFVIVDATPVLPVSDAVVLQQFVDGFLLVVRARHTPRGAILDCLARLRSDTVIGFILNDCTDPAHSYRANAYRNYGMAYGVKSPEDPKTGDR